MTSRLISSHIVTAVVVCLVALEAAIALASHAYSSNVYARQADRKAIAPVTGEQLANRELYSANRLGLSDLAYAADVDQVSNAADGSTAAAPTFAWEFIGPQPMQGQQSNFGGQVFGKTFNATGRVTAIQTAILPNGVTAICVGTANGGVWMSSDSGKTFVSITDWLPTQAIGAILGCGPGMLVGTGEGNNSLDSYYGRGMWTTSDLKKWTQVGAAQFGKQSISSITQACDHTFATTAAGSSFSRGGAYVKVSNGGHIYESVDYGKTWVLSFSAPGSRDIHSLINDGGFNNALVVNVFATVDGSGLYRAVLEPDIDFSTCSGSPAPSHWTKLPVPASQFGRASVSFTVPCIGNSQACAAGDDHVYVMVGAASGGPLAGFFASTDYGTSWVSRSVPSAVFGTTAIDGTSPSNFSRSSRDQALWVIGQNSFQEGSLDSLIFGGEGVYSSADSGKTWKFDVPDGGTHEGQHTVTSLNGANQFLVENNGGLYAFNAATDTWTAMNNSIRAGQIHGIGPHPTDRNRMLAGFQDNGTQLYTGGLGWKVVDTADGGFALFDHKNPGFAYHTYSTSSSGPNIAFSDDEGETWNFQSPTANLQAAIGSEGPASPYPPIAVDPGVAKRVLFGARSIFVSIDGMKTWQRQTGLDMNPGCKTPYCALGDIEFAPKDRVRAFAIANQSGAIPFRVFSTEEADTNSGAEWSEVTANLGFDTTKTQATTVAISSANANVVFLGLSGFTATTHIGHIYKSDDFGSKWERSDSGLPDVPVLKLLVDRNDSTGKTVFAGTDMGMFRSIDGGSTWAQFNLGVIPAVPVFDIEQNDMGDTFIGTHGRGAYRLEITGK